MSDWRGPIGLEDGATVYAAIGWHARDWRWLRARRHSTPVQRRLAPKLAGVSAPITGPWRSPKRRYQMGHIRRGQSRRGGQASSAMPRAGEWDALASIQAVRNFDRRPFSSGCCGRKPRSGERAQAGHGLYRTGNKRENRQGGRADGKDDLTRSPRFPRLSKRLRYGKSLQNYLPNPMTAISPPALRVS